MIRSPADSTAFDPAPFLASIETETTATLTAARRDLAAPVPTCEGWTVRDVLAHLGRVHRSVAEIVERRSTEIPPVEIPSAPGGEEVLEFFAEGATRMLLALGTLGPETPLYTWQGIDAGRFYFRRMAHELEIHRFDVESAFGEPGPFDAGMAVDGIDEVYEVLLPFSARRWERALPAGTLHLHRADGPGEWFVTGADGSVRMTHEHAKGDAAVRGSASDLYRFVWHRGSGPSVEVLGDATVAEAWAGLAP